MLVAASAVLILRTIPNLVSFLPQETALQIMAEQQQQPDTLLLNEILTHAATGTSTTNSTSTSNSNSTSTSTTTNTSTSNSNSTATSTFTSNSTTTTNSTSTTTIGFDMAAPAILSTMTHYLPSIPSHRQLPPPPRQEDNVEEETILFKNMNWTGRNILFTYNPSIVILPETYRKHHDNNNNNSTTAAVYLASFRVSSHHSCGIRAYSAGDTMVDYLGLALLDTHLTILTNVVIDVNAHDFVLVKIMGRNRQQHWQDYRLFVVHEQIYISSYTMMLPISIQSISILNENTTAATGEQTPPLLFDHSFTNLFGTDIHVTYSSVVNIYSTDKLLMSKNHNFFPCQQGKLCMEVWPARPRVVTTLTLSNNSTTNDNNSTNYNVESVHITVYEPSIDSTIFDDAQTGEIPYRFSRDRGSACCIRLDKTMYQNFTKNATILSHDYALMGITHIKSFRRIPSPRGGEGFAYMSRLYAFAPTPPFELLARSSMFCFGFGFGSITESPGYTRDLIRNDKLMIKDKVYQCPRITFISGMTETLSNDHVIIAYGVNDCIPVMVKVEKQELAQRLFFHVQ